MKWGKRKTETERENREKLMQKIENTKKVENIGRKDKERQSDERKINKGEKERNIYKMKDTKQTKEEREETEKEKRVIQQ